MIFLFVGEAFCIIPYSCRKEKHDQVEIPRKVSYLMLVPSAIDVLNSCLVTVGLIICAASVFQILRGNVIVVNAIISIIFLKRKLYCHHLIALIIILGGIALVGFVSIKASATENVEKDRTSILGVLLLISATICAGGRYAFEEKFMCNYKLDPYYVVGMEGLIGTLMGIIILFMFNFFKCEGQLCPHGFLASARYFISEQRDHPLLIFYTFIRTVSVGLSRLLGAMITK